MTVRRSLTAVAAAALGVLAGCGEHVEVPGTGAEGGSEDGGAAFGERASCKPAQLLCAGQSCCAYARVPGGAFDRYNDPSFPATVSAFDLDLFEVTVGRFRPFVEAVKGGFRPAAGAGASPHAKGSGWDPAWNDGVFVEGSLGDLPPTGIPEIDDYKTWTDEPGPNEGMPIAFVPWAVAQAFCIWDGGRLPTIAEWLYAASGGDEQRKYPWGDSAPTPEHAVLRWTPDEPGYPNFFTEVGTVPKGAGRWGHMDLFGSRRELLMDGCPVPFEVRFDPLLPCHDCMRLPLDEYPTWIGLSVEHLPDASPVEAGEWSAGDPRQADRSSGLRCVYGAAATEGRGPT